AAFFFFDFLAALRFFAMSITSFLPGTLHNHVALSKLFSLGATRCGAVRRAAQPLVQRGAARSRFARAVTSSGW
ncbi:MAG: hypothetical protein ACE5E6_06725, partial [Phycisphaerae bacterium]